jgi:hypothetical protein
MTTLINFSHSVTPEQRSSVERLTGQGIERVIDVSVQFDDAASFGGQAAGLVDRLELSSTEWQTLPVLFCLPELSTIVAAVLAELHGRLGYFPSIVRRRRAASEGLVAFEIAEIVNLQEVRENARARR